MIDTELINKAEEKSKVIEAVDQSWRTFVNDLKEGIFAKNQVTSRLYVKLRQFLIGAGIAGCLSKCTQRKKC